jgi:FKBP-type peptidyl-prolyl cis-trans isomerase 2
MVAITKGQSVTFLCSSFLEDGTCLDGEGENLPIVMQAGKAGANPFSTSIANLLVGMAPNEMRDCDLAPEQAFGAFNPKKVIRLPRRNYGSVAVGMEVKVPQQDNSIHRSSMRSSVHGTVIELDQNYALVDTNHPFAGQRISVRVTVISVT